MTGNIIRSFVDKELWVYQIYFDDVLNAPSRVWPPTQMLVRMTDTKDAPSAYRYEIHLVGIKNNKILKSKLLHISWCVNAFLTEDECKRSFREESAKLIIEMQDHIANVTSELNKKLQYLDTLSHYDE